MEAPLKVKLNEDLKQALRGDKVKLRTIRMVISAVKNAEMAKKAKLVTAAYKKAGITDLGVLEGHPEKELTAAQIAEIGQQAEFPRSRHPGDFREGNFTAPGQHRCLQERQSS